MTHAERSFLQGVLAHAPALCAFTLPTAFSYARVADGIWSGGTYASWGTEQREALVRLTGAEGQHHFEVRFVDGTASPYLVLASVLGVGTQAVVKERLLESGDCVTPVALMGEEEKARLGVQNAERLPSTLDQARKNLAGDKDLREVFGEDFVEKYIGVNAVRVRTVFLVLSADALIASGEHAHCGHRGRDGHEASQLLLISLGNCAHYGLLWAHCILDGNGRIQVTAF